MKLHHFALFALWQYALVDSRIENFECCPNNNTMIDFVCQDEKVPTQNKSVLQCSTEMFEFEFESLLEEEDFHQLSPGRFCFGNKVKKDNGTGTHNSNVRVIVLCFPVVDFDVFTNTFSFIVSLLTLFMSIIALVLTLIVYIIVPDLRDLQGLCIVCLCGSFILGYLNTILLRILRTDTEGVACYIIGFGMYYWLLAAFFWMNIISIDIMRTVTFKNYNKADKRTFLYYNLYGWGMPLLLLVITLTANFIEGYHIKPRIGELDCWFYGDIESWAYFYGPIAIIMVANFVLFCVASRALWYKTNNNNATKFKSMKYKFCLYIKLSFITGFIWLFELFSFSFDSLYVTWIIADMLNTLLGVIYFLILVVFRKRALRGLAKLGLRIPCVSNIDEIEEEEEEIIEEDQTEDS